MPMTGERAAVTVRTMLFVLCVLILAGALVGGAYAIAQVVQMVAASVADA